MLGIYFFVISRDAPFHVYSGKEEEEEEAVFNFWSNLPPGEEKDREN